MPGKGPPPSPWPHLIKESTVFVGLRSGLHGDSDYLRITCKYVITITYEKKLYKIPAYKLMKLILLR